jgi:mono/diheme cytochrome c family protein
MSPIGRLNLDQYATRCQAEAWFARAHVPRCARRPRSPFSALLFAACLAAGCQQKMADQPSFRPDDPTAFFADGSSSRHPVRGTVARGHLRTDAALYFGNANLPDSPLESRPSRDQGASQGTGPLLAAEAAQFAGAVDEFPFPITRAVVEHGRNRFMIYCVVCHDAAGTGHGKIVERGYTRPPSYHIDRLRQVPVGYLFRVVTQGYGSMPSYARQIPARDRWAIVSYVRALQMSQHFPIDKLPEDMRRKLDAHDKLATTAGGTP